MYKRVIRNYLGAIALVGLVLAGGIAGVMKYTVDQLLYWDATSTAEDWAKTIIFNVRDVAKIADGATPSAQSMQFLISTQRMRTLFGFEINDTAGHTRLLSDGSGIVDLQGRKFDALAARAADERKTMVRVSHGTPPARPAIYSVAYVPLVAGGKTHAVVAAYIDLTEKAAHFRLQFILAALALCGLTSVALGVPLAAWLKQRKAKEHADRHIAYLIAHDSLTDLANRSALTGLLNRYLERKLPFALHHIDVDRFKSINEIYGYAAGDALLQKTAERLRALAQPGDVVARLAGDEFALLQLNVGAEAAGVFAGRILDVLALPVVRGKQRITATASLGCALAPRDGDTAERLFKSASLALDKSKSDGRNVARFFAAELDEALECRRRLEQTLRNAVAYNLLELHFQPVFRIADQRLCGFEALLRMRDNDGAMVPPSIFIPLAEELGLIGKIGAWLVREACRHAAQWPEHLWVAINISPAQFETGPVADDLLQALAEHKLAPERLEIEITESVMLNDRPEVATDLRRIKEAGIAVVIDDFGTGYSSMSYLWRFPFDKIKIDRSFMEGFAARSPNIETVIKTIVGLARSLGMRVNVEGVETAAQAAFIEQLECDEVQGFLFGRPLPVIELPAIIFADFHRGRGNRPPLHLVEMDTKQPPAERASM